MDHHDILRLLFARGFTATSIGSWPGRGGPTELSPSDLVLWGWAKGEI